MCEVEDGEFIQLKGRVSVRPQYTGWVRDHSYQMHCMLNKRVKLDTSLQEQQAIADPKEFREIIFHCVKWPKMAVLLRGPWGLFKKKTL